MEDDLNIPFDRVTYRDGQLLTAQDLNDDRNREAWLRRLHTRYLHGSWGIALGFEVELGDPGKLKVAPGHAVDGLGRDLLLATAVQIPVPNVSTSVVLLMRFPDDRRTDLLDLRAVCPGEGGPMRDRPLFSWRRCEEVRQGLEIPLVRITPPPRSELDLAVRRYARARARPHVAWGESERGRTAWKSWIFDRKNLGLELRVDTSIGAFRKRPCFFAMLRVPVSTQASGEDVRTVPVGSFSHIAEATTTGFVYRLMSSALSPTLSTVSLDEAKKGRWTLSWFGIEPETKCGAHPSWFVFIPLSPGFVAP
jgi:hypothetical protein